MFAAASTNSWLDGVGDDYSDQSSRRPISISKVDLQNEKQRLVIPEDEEWNTVLGGGFLKGSLILLGGDPGVGKSTLALQVAAHVAKQSTPSVGIGMGSNTNDSTTPTTTMMGPVWYVSGEETLTQIAIRAQRLETVSPQLFLLAETNLNAVAEQVVQLLHHPVVQNDEQPPLELPPSLIVIDSIQTMMCEAGGTSSSGGVVQLRECMALLLRLAKSTKIPIVAIGHVTKSGDVAGPRMVEHMVDAVLYLEPGNQQQRWLRAAKNRFGSCQNVGLYEFKSGKLVPTPPDSDAFAASSSSFDDLEGCAMSISLEGPYRAIISEVQALVTTSSSFVGKKTVDGGFSYARLQLLLGVLQKHCSVFIGKSRDVYLNVVSGASSSNKQTATGLDLAVAVALTSSLVSIPVRGDTVFLAQVGLLGELRPLSSMEPRLLQAQRMGFSRIITAGRKFQTKRNYNMECIECPTLKQALEFGLTEPIPKRKVKQRKQQTSDSSSSSRKKKTPTSPGSLNALELEDIIIDDEDDEDDYYY
jgi:DNA repair protein RadA/Sms